MENQRIATPRTSSTFHTPGDLVRLGRNCERVAIAKGIRFHVHDRTIIDGHRAIVFPD